MKDPNGFDELARQKLAERDHAFDQSHWTDMERLLADRERKPKALWPWIVAGALLLGGTALWSVNDQESAPVPSPDGAVEEQVERSTTTSETTATVQVSSSTLASPGADTLLLPPEASPVKEALADAVQASSGRASTTGPSDAAPTRPTEVLQADVQHVGTLSSSDTPIEQVEMRPSTVTLADSTTSDRTPALNNPEPSSAPYGPVNDPAAVIASTVTASEVPGIIRQEKTNIVDPRTASENAAIPEPLQQPVELASEESAEPSPAIAEPGTPGTEPPAPGMVEPNVTPPVPAEWLAVRTPFELSLMGGAFSTTSDYRGSGTETWKASTERQHALGAGIEGVWDISRHFGLGLGAHYSSYKERLIAEELSRTDEVLSNSYFWVQHDTMVLTVVGDTTIGATTYNITELVPMTINELGVDTDTSYNTTVLRQRRSTTNTVNYIEVPLLLDAHTSCGRWVFGLRGGPTVGMLTSKQGSVPDDSETGYSDLNGRTFSSMTLGCMARIYARYRLSSAWAIGVEPTWRQQLGNAFNDADVQRRCNAFGGYLSLSYRFAPKSVMP